MGNFLGDLIDKEVARAEVALQDVRGRALNFVGVAGGLVTVVGGATAIVVGTHQNVSISVLARWCLAIALIAYVLATLVALGANVAPRRVFMVDPHGLSDLVESHWNDEGWDKQVAAVSLRYLMSLRQATAQIGRWMFLAAALEIVGIAFTGAVAVLIVSSI
ncbi:MAG: hypothetical protein WCF63_09575 [Acidimicrobiales bacterium]|jgi:hypothetical protein